MGRSWRASSDLTAQKIRLFYSQKMLTKYEAFFTEIYENDRFSQGVGWKCKVFFANPVLGGRTKSAVRAHNHSYDWIIYCKRRFCAGSRFRWWNRTFREPMNCIETCISRCIWACIKRQRSCRTHTHSYTWVQRRNRLNPQKNPVLGFGVCKNKLYTFIIMLPGRGLRKYVIKC